MEVIVLWESNGILHEYTLKPGKTYYIGRPTGKYFKKHPNLHGDGVYILPEDPENPPHYTGYHTLLVSRLDTKIHVDPDQQYITIKDHGPQGFGSKNPTYINGIRLKPGEEKTIPLNTDSSIVLELTSQGPSFIIAIKEIDKPTITLESGTIITLPKTIAQQLEITGAVKESVDMGPNKLTIIQQGNYKLDAPQFKLIIKEALQDAFKEILLGDIKIRLDEIRKYQRLEGELIDSYKTIETAMLNPQLTQLIYRKLATKEYKDLIWKLGKEAQVTYQELLLLLRDTYIYDKTHIREIKQRIITLQEIIKKKILDQPILI